MNNVNHSSGTLHSLKKGADQIRSPSFKKGMKTHSKFTGQADVMRFAPEVVAWKGYLPASPSSNLHKPYSDLTQPSKIDPRSFWETFSKALAAL